MKGSLLRTLSQSTLNLLPSNRCKLNPYSIPPTLCSSSFRLFSSKTLDQSQKEDGDISMEDLRKLMDKFYEGDEEAFPTVFEALMRRVMAGKSDEEIRKEFSSDRGKDDNESDSH